MNNNNFRRSLSSDKPVLGYEEPDRDVEPVMEQAPDRRRLVRRLLALAGLGITSVLLSQDKTGLLPAVHATYVSYSDTNDPVISAENTSSTGASRAVWGSSDSTSGIGVEGTAGASTGSTVGVLGYSDSTAGLGVEGFNTASTGSATGVLGQSNSTSGTGVRGYAAASGGVALLGSAGNDGAIPIVAEANSSNQTAPLQEWRGSSGPLSVVDATGRFGIGTTSPSHPLDVYQNTSANDQIRTVQAGTGNASFLAQNTNGTTVGAALGATSSEHGFVGTTSPHPLQIQVNNTAVMYALMNGNVGIGTTTPARSVHLVGSNACFRMDRNTDSSSFILVRTDPTFSKVWKTFYVGVNSPGAGNGSFFIGDNGTNVAGTSTTRLIIDNTGRVGLGRTPSANNLEVEGTASKTTAGSWLANSDMRIKTEVSDIDDALATIRKLHPVRFRYTDSYKAKHPSIKNHPYYNFIAQEYREVFPDSVQDDGEGLLQMDSYNTTPYLVRAVQELSKQNEALAERDSELAEQNQTAVIQLTERDTELAEQNEALREEVRLLKSRLDAFEQSIKLAAN